MMNEMRVVSLEEVDVVLDNENAINIAKLIPNPPDHHDAPSYCILADDLYYCHIPSLEGYLAVFNDRNDIQRYVDQVRNDLHSLMAQGPFFEFIIDKNKLRQQLEHAYVLFDLSMHDSFSDGVSQQMVEELYYDAFIDPNMIAVSHLPMEESLKAYVLIFASSIYGIDTQKWPLLWRDEFLSWWPQNLHESKDYNWADYLIEQTIENPRNIDISFVRALALTG